MTKIVMVALLFMFASVATVACGPQESLAPDLALNFDCKVAPSETLIEAFLKRQHFEVANLERVRRQFHQDFFPLDIEAVDKRSWIITFRGLDIPAVPTRPEKTYYTVVVNSPPPTRHDENFENAIAVFVSQGLGCQITSNGRDKNPASAADFFEQILSTQKSRMHEAEICDKSTPTYDAAECAKVPGVEQ